ncbi:MAG: hypothetical protein EA376_05615 [Phycisphaeraceae bacterium]|nr:MAG: hypothetical protein EA376_05615 [Phycisphaeraceae bacterium]
MTTEQHMLFSLRTALLALVTLTTIIGGCAGEKLREPRPLTWPHAAPGESTLWAVAPLRNESGVGVFDPLLVTDALASQVQQVRGINVLPTNRVLGAMRTLNMQAVDSPESALRLAEALEVDAILVGSITAWEPYDPLQFGMSLAIFRPSDDGRSSSRIDPRALQSAASDYGLFMSRDGSIAPSSFVAEHLHGANHEIQMAARAFAEGRHDPATALGWRRYLASMTLFTEFACYHLTERLLDAERIRHARTVAAETSR